MSDTVQDPFGSEPDETDPFATPEDVKSSGVFTPVPALPYLEGRLVAMIPRKFEDDAPIPSEYVQKDGPTVRDRYTVDMYVLDGGELRFTYNAKVEGKEEREEKEHVVSADELPAEFKNVWRVEQALIGQLRKIDGTARPILLGTVRRGPQAKDRNAGKTFADIEEAYRQYLANPAKVKEPRFSWQMDVEITPEQRKTALAWWSAAGIKL